MQQFMVEQIKMQDKIFFDTGVENEEFEESLMIFMRTDPQVQAEMQQYQMKMQMEAQRQMMAERGMEWAPTQPPPWELYTRVVSFFIRPVSSFERNNWDNMSNCHLQFIF